MIDDKEENLNQIKYLLYTEGPILATMSSNIL
jgi:hypothetical protein